MNRLAGFWVTVGGLLILLITWSVSLLVIRADRKLEIERAQQGAANMAELLERHVSITFSQVETGLFFLRHDWETERDIEKMGALLARFVSLRTNLYNLVSIINAEGYVVVTDLKQFTPTYSGDRPFFIYHQTHTNRAMQVGGAIFGRVTGRWYLPVSVRLDDEKGRFAGVLLASVNPYYFSMLFQNMAPADESLVYLADERGVLYSGMQNGREIPLDAVVTQDGLSLPSAESSSLQAGATEYFRGAEHVQHRAALENRDMYVSVELGLTQWLKQLRVRSRYLLFTQVLLTLFVLFVVFRLRRVLTSQEAANRELDRFFSSALDLLCIGDTQGRFIRVNREWEKTLGYRADELEGRLFLDFVHPDDLEKTQEAMRNLEQQNAVHQFSNRYRCRDGSYRHIEWRSSPQGNMIYAAARDVTDRIRTEQALRDSEARFRQIFEQAPIPLQYFSLDGRVLAVNESLTKLLGYEQADIDTADKWFEKAYPDPAYRAGVMQEWQVSVEKATEGGSDIETHEFTVVGKDGAPHDVLFRGTMLPGNTVLISMMDVTELKRSARELERHRDHLEELVHERTMQLTEAKERAEAANQAKSVFLTKMSHELRTPLNAILGYAQLFRKRPLDDDLLKGLGVMQQSGEHLLSMINNLLSISRMETTRPEIHPGPMALAPFLRSLVGIVRPRADEKGLALRLDVPVPLPAGVVADETQLRRVLINLLMNAVKFTKEGRVVFRVVCLDERNLPLNQVKLLFAVEDTGAGIPAEQLSRLFRPFEQLGENVRCAEGSGLGLAISRQIVQQMGSDISITTEPGKGSVFSFTLVLPIIGDRAGEAVTVQEELPVSGWSDDSDAICPREELPSLSELQALRDLAQMGDLSAVEDRCKILIENHPLYAKFTGQLMEWASAFEEVEVIRMIETALQLAEKK